MRYIEKIVIEQLHNTSTLKPLLDYINKTTGRNNKSKAPIHPNYGDIKGALKKGLLKQLRAETYGLCCFCQQQVIGEMIEHFLPQGTANKLFTNEEVDYYNMFFCCIKSNQCSSSKANDLVGKFITHPKCESFFKYVHVGTDEIHILPNVQKLASWEDCEKNLISMSIMEQQAFVTIKALGLNNSTLSQNRKIKLNEDGLLKRLKGIKTNKVLLEEEKNKYLPNNTKKTLPEFSGMFLYFIEEQLKKI